MNYSKPWTFLPYVTLVTSFSALILSVFLWIRTRQHMAAILPLMANTLPLTKATIILTNESVVLSYLPTLKHLTETSGDYNNNPTTPVMTTILAVLCSLLILYGLILTSKQIWVCLRKYPVKDIELLMEVSTPDTRVLIKISRYHFFRILPVKP